MSSRGEPSLRLLETRSLSKRFGRVQALTGVDVSVHAGSVLALLGDNGAGKSTLVKILSGAYRPDAGEILIDGQPRDIGSPREATEAGIETVYQDLALCDNLTVIQNLFLGRERRKSGIPFARAFLDRRSMEREAVQAFESPRRADPVPPGPGQQSLWRAEAGGRHRPRRCMEESRRSVR